MSTEPSSQSPQPYSSLNDFFSEINAFSITLRKLASALHHDDNLPSGGRAVLGILKDHGPSSVPQIARRYSSSRQNIQMVVNRLTQLQLLESEHNPAHKRSPVIRLSPEGVRLMARVDERESHARAQLLGQLGEDEIQSATEFLKRARSMLLPKDSISKPTDTPNRPQRAERRSHSPASSSPQAASATTLPSPKPSPQQGPTSPPEPDYEELPISML